MSFKIHSRYTKTLPSGSRYHIYQTTKGKLTAEEVAKIIGITANALTQRIRTYGLHDEHVLMHRHQGTNTGTEGNADYRELSGKVRGGQEKIKIGWFEKMIPDRFDPKKAEQYDREGWTYAQNRY